jgi:hypothetical protein
MGLLYLYYSVHICSVQKHWTFSVYIWYYWGLHELLSVTLNCDLYLSHLNIAIFPALLRDRWSAVGIPVGVRSYFLLQNPSIPALGPSQPPQIRTRALAGAQAAGAWPWPLIPSSAKVRIEWSSPSVPHGTLQGKLYLICVAQIKCNHFIKRHSSKQQNYAWRQIRNW